MVADLVSVIICAWNNWPDLEMAIESAIHQSYRPVEVVVVDNSSVDATQHEVPRRFGDRIKYVRQSNRDTGGAYNTGFELSRGAFVQFLDGDDVLAPNKIERQMEVFSDDPTIDIVYGDVAVFQRDAGPARWTFPQTRQESDMLLAILSSHVGICTDVGMLFRRQTIKEVGPWDESLYVEDLDYLIRAAWVGCRFKYCAGGPMGFARRRPNAKTASVDAMDLGNEAVWVKACNYITEEPYRRLLMAKLASLRLNMAVFRGQRTRSEVMRILKLARATDALTVSPFIFWAARLSLLFPGGRTMIRAPWLRPVRRLVRSAGATGVM
jgi:glycosyltransferase involved in cell wall biosynthesis